MNAKPEEAGHEHLVQFYGGDDARLGRNVARFLSESLRGGGGALVIASPARRESIGRELASERVVYLDDKETLAKFLGSDGRPDPTLFDACVGALARELAEKYGGFRAYGEMVGVLWSQRSFTAAIALEGLWNALIASVGFDLFCGYPIDVLGEEFQLACVHPLLDSHTRVVPAIAHNFDIAMRRAMDDVVGNRNDGLRSLRAEAMILRLRSTLPRYADDILAKAQEYAQA
ncbi:MAG TPA: MEDS domain-containing protein [Candidatus Cybelea sp.]|nr:MEDS domain-containing protein [Candidatus Cybelea sp.]